MIAVTLFLAPVAAALALIRRYHHLDVATVTVLISISLGLPVVWLTWAVYRDGRRSQIGVDQLTLDAVADQLALAVGAQWEAEAAIRRLNDPYPLPVSWTAADEALADGWDSLVRLAQSGAGWPLPQLANTWATGPQELAGDGTDLVTVLTRVPTGRLVVLGEPGSGKTMLMVRLVLDLLARRTGGAPVPVLFSIASWNPEVTGLTDWITTELNIGHPALTATTPPGKEHGSCISALLSAGLILPILDGLDEIPEEIRGSAVARINDALRPGEKIVLTCRTQEYRNAVISSEIEVRMRSAAVIELQPLNAQAVSAYLHDDAAGPVAAARWAPVLAVLGTETPVGQALSTPLMVGLARVIYNPRPGELAGVLHDPAELCNPDLNDRAAVESHLFDAFIPAAYRSRTMTRWTAQDAKPWLVFLACYLQQTTGDPNFIWWQLWLAIPELPLVAVPGLIVALIVGLATGFGSGPYLGVAAGIIAGLMAAFLVRSLTWRKGLLRPARGIRMTRLGLFLGAVIGIVLGIVGSLTGGTTAGLIFGLGGLVYGLLFGLESSPLDFKVAASPRSTLRRDFRAAVILTLTPGLVFGFSLGLVFGFATGPVAGVAVGIAALIGAGIVGGFSDTRYPSYWLALIWLVLNRRLPWSFMEFLGDAHQRGVLRQAGAVYQFRHVELQHHLAATALPSLSHNSWRKRLQLPKPTDVTSENSSGTTSIHRNKS